MMSECPLRLGQMKETLNTGCRHFIQATSQLHLTIDLSKPCCWGKKWAQLFVPAWSLAYTYGVLMAFLSLFKELNLIWVMSVVVCVWSQWLHQNKQSSSDFKTSHELTFGFPWLCPNPAVDLLYLQKVSTAFSTYAWKQSKKKLLWKIVFVIITLAVWLTHWTSEQKERKLYLTT